MKNVGIIEACHKYLKISSTILVSLAISVSCNKINITPPNGFSIRLYNEDPKNTFSGITSDQNGNIYTMENRSDSDSVIIKKFDHNGNLLYHKGISYLKTHTSGFVFHDIGNGLILIGDTGRQTQYDSRFVLEFKLDYDANVQWIKKLPFFQVSNISVGQNQDYMIYGTWLDSKYNLFLPYVAKSDLNGNILWQKELSQNPWDAQFDQTTSSGFFTRDDGFVFYGNSPNAFSHVLITRVDPSGNVLWHDTVGPGDCKASFGYTGDITACAAINPCETTDGHLVFGIGANANFGQATFMFAAVCDKNGNGLTVKNLNLDIENNFGSNIASANCGMTDDNGFYIGAETSIKGNVSKNNMLIAKYDPGFNPVFTKTYGGYYNLNSGSVIPYNNKVFLLGMTSPAFGQGANGVQIIFMVVDENGNQ